MDSISNPWWLGGNICAGVPFGAEIASKLGARLWISAHDGEKDVRGLATALLKTYRWNDEEIESVLDSRASGVSGNDHKTGQNNAEDKPKGARRSNTEILRLKCGEEILVSGTGQLWRTTASDGDTQSTPNIAKAIGVPPPPTIMAAPTGLKQKGKHSKKTPEMPVLPKVQDGMSPKKLAIYKALKTIDLIRPSPRLVLEQHVTSNLASTLQDPKVLPVQSLAEIKTEKAAEVSVVDGTVPKSDPSDATLSTRSEIPT